MSTLRIVDRRRSLDEIADLAVAYARAHVATLIVPLSVLCAGTLLLIFLTQRALDLDWGRTWILALIESAVVTRISMAIFAAHLTGGPAQLTGGLRTVLDRPALLVTPGVWPWITLLAIDPVNGASLTAALGFVFLTPVFLVRGAFAHALAIFDQLPIKRALEISVLLTRTRAPRTLALVFLGVMVLGVCATIGDQLVSWVAVRASVDLPFDTLSEEYGSWGAIGGLLTGSPFVALLRVLEYLDARAAQ
ncbi:MAG: hypothetical protein HY791_39135 [Deltaproteobacteria bacterium]|nr:hypothetical protein [Deltaproteobacteria bacterium]